MSPNKVRETVRQACLRCRNQKRKCDKEYPRCSLCIRLDRSCVYESTSLSPSASPASSSELPRAFVGAFTPTPISIKIAIIQRLSVTSPEHVASTYCRTIYTWFPIISESNLCGRLPWAWEDANPDFCLLFLTIVLLTSISEPRPSQTLSSDLQALYLCCKSSTAILEGLGLNSLDLVQARLLITLFEVFHGLYPAAYTSLGTLVAAADVLFCYPEQKFPTIHSETKEGYKEECIRTWRGIVILDRFISLSNGRCPPITKGRSNPERLSTSAPPSVEETTPIAHAFSRLFEASELLHLIETDVATIKSGRMLDLDQSAITVKILSVFHKSLEPEVPERLKVYSSGWIVFNSGLVLLHETGCREKFSNTETLPRRVMSHVNLCEMLNEIAGLVKPYVDGDAVIDFQKLPPFIIYLVYQAASILTEAVVKDDGSEKQILLLKALRNMLKLLSERWLAADKFLRLLDEDTTPRLMKEME